MKVTNGATILSRAQTLPVKGWAPNASQHDDQIVSRELVAYRSPSPTALAARQLAEYDKDLRPGQVVRFVFTLGKPGVRARDVPGWLDRRTIDIARYSTLLERAAETIFQTFLSDGIEARLP